MVAKIVEILSAQEIRRTITRLASQVIEKSPDITQLVLIGIYTRGFPLAELIAQQIKLLEGIDVPVGGLDVTFYRDDLDQIGMRTPSARTQIPIDINGKELILVDDVLFKGRTVRAALNAISEYGRPKNIRLLILVDRGHRELPICPDYVGKQLPTALEEKVKFYIQAYDDRDSLELVRVS